MYQFLFFYKKVDFYEKHYIITTNLYNLSLDIRGGSGYYDKVNFVEIMLFSEKKQKKQRNQCSKNSRVKKNKRRGNLESSISSFCMGGSYEFIK